MIILYFSLCSNTTNSEEQVHLKDEDCDSCFSVWHSGPDGTNQVITQGCWTKGIALNCIQDDQCVHNPKLLATQMSKKWSNVSLCCCRGFMCNDNLVTYSKTLTQEEKITIPVLILIAVSLAGVMLAVVLSIVFAAKNRKLRRRKEKNTLEYVTDDCYARVENGKNICTSPKEKLLSNSPNSDIQNSKLPQQPHFSLNHFLFDGVVSEETITTVVHHLKRRRHTSGGGESDKGPAEVAGKKFKSSQIHRFQKETKVYRLLNELDHKSKFFLLWYGSYENETGGGDGSGEQDKDLLICLELAPLGPLSFFLTANTLDWLQLSNMLLDISRGIALLHNNLNTGEGRHVTVCHRDLNTTNILVRADLSCCISNFSHAIVIEPNSKVDFENEFKKGSLGSVRYLAPELLDGSLNVSDLENSLKQVDVYALGLLFWEASRRCRDLYQGVAVPQFELAYEKEMGTSPPPTSEQMRILVAKHKARPLFPEVWKDSNPAIQMLKETITESWEEEGEARLTTCCILERFQIIDTEMQRYKLVSQGPPSVDKSWLNNTQPERSNATGEVARLERSFNNEATTANSRKKDNIISGQRPTIRIQPHQGKQYINELCVYLLTLS